METVIVVVIVSVVVLWACRATYRMFTGKGRCNCPSSSCPIKDNCNQSQEKNDETDSPQ